jgi:hypothetical protein
VGLNTPSVLVRPIYPCGTVTTSHPIIANVLLLDTEDEAACVAACRVLLSLDFFDYRYEAYSAADYYLCLYRYRYCYRYCYGDCYGSCYRYCCDSFFLDFYLFVLLLASWSYISYPGSSSSSISADLPVRTFIVLFSNLITLAKVPTTSLYTILMR